MKGPDDDNSKVRYLRPMEADAQGPSATATDGDSLNAVGADDRQGVVAFDCVRFEESLKEGHWGDAAKTHHQQCPSCASLAADMEEVLTDIVAATAARDVGPSFESAVLLRSGGVLQSPAHGTENTLPRETGPDRSVLWGLLAAAAVIVAFIAGGMQEQARPEHRDMARMTQPVGLSPQLQSTTPSRGAGALKPHGNSVSPRHRPDPVRWNLAATGDRLTETDGTDEMQPSPSREERPEQPMDITSELRDAILREVERQPSCPQHSVGNLTITMTVNEDGSLSNRQILSPASAFEGHGCVNYALDALLLPPLPSAATTVTFELGW